MVVLRVAAMLALVNGLLLTAAGKFLNQPTRLSRIVPGACLGAALVAVGMGFGWADALWWRVAALLAASVITYGRHLWPQILFWLLHFSLGGLSAPGTGWLPVVLGAVGISLACALTGNRRNFLPVTITQETQTLHLIALRDTGNTLRDPITGQPVLVVSAQVGQQLTGLSREQLAHPLETLTKRPLPGLRLIPYRAVGQAGGMLLGLPLKQVSIDGRQTSAVVAFAPEGLEEGSYQALVTGGAL